MRTRRLSPRTRTRCLACGLFLIGLSTTASLLSPANPQGDRPGIHAQPKATLAADVKHEAQPAPGCSAAG
jgi:hypothetical protein